MGTQKGPGTRQVRVPQEALLSSYSRRDQAVNWCVMYLMNRTMAREVCRLEGSVW